MADSIIGCENWQEADVVLLLANYDRTSSFGKGADRGPQAIVDCLHTQIEFYDRLSNSTPASQAKIAIRDLGDLNKYSPDQMLEILLSAYNDCANKSVFLIGGEHSVSNGPFAHFAKQSEAITIVQVDAHADLRDDDSDYNDTPFGKLAHCSVMHRALDIGYNIVQVGIRAYSKAEQALFEDPKVTTFEWGITQPNISNILSAIKTERVYLTIDADGLDPAHMPATGTPVPGGLSWNYSLELIKEICRNHSLVGADLVEVAPVPNSSLTEYAAAQLIYSTIGCWLSTNN